MRSRWMVGAGGWERWVLRDWGVGGEGMFQGCGEQHGGEGGGVWSEMVRCAG